jgi:predicted transcriptional regulator
MFTLEEIDTRINQHQEFLEMLKAQLQDEQITTEDFYKIANSSYMIINHLNELRVSKLKKLLGKETAG